MFEFARFRRLAAAQWMESWRSWAWFLAIGVLLHFLVVLGSLLTERGERLLDLDAQAGLYFMGLFLTAPLFAGRYFQGMGQRESAGVLLMRPAHALEKWLLAVLVVGLAYPLAYSLAFEVCNLPGGWLAAVLAEARHAAEVAAAGAAGQGDRPAFDATRYGLMMPWEPWTDPDMGSAIIPALLWLTGLQAFALFGSLHFRTMPFIKTLVLAVALVIVSVLLPAAFGDPDGGFMSFWDESRGRDFTPAQSLLYGAAWLGTPALLWLSGLLALREREVA